MKILVCGKGPSLLDQLKDRSLDDFDLVVRVNNWREVDGYDNRCDAWVFYPWHHICDSLKSENKYNVLDLIPKAKEHWIVHEMTINEAVALLGKYPDFVLTNQKKAAFLKETGLVIPRTGILALHCAMLISNDVWACGFDFYEGDKEYYFSDQAPPDWNIEGKLYVHDHPQKEKEWFMEQVKNRRLKVL